MTFLQQPKRNLSLCTEWEALPGSDVEVSNVLSPRERRSQSLAKEDSTVWVQVPEFKQKWDKSFDNVSLQRSNSFDGSHFIVLVGGMSMKLPFMSSLEVY